MNRNRKDITIFLILILPSIVLQYILIKLFPYTGLGRIVTIPATIALNLTFIAVYFIISNKYGHRVLNITFILLLSILMTIVLYPQESYPPVYVQSTQAIHAIRDFDQITIEDLEINDDVTNNPRYVVALYKFKDTLLSKGTYQLYQQENVYFYTYSINNLEEIPSKLIGYHKVMWWYLEIKNTFNLLLQ